MNISVKVIARQGRTELIEFVEGGTLQRVYVPIGTAVEGSANNELLELGIDVGVPWASLAQPMPVDVIELERELRRRGIWTHDDLVSSPQIAIGILIKLCGLSVANLITAARKYEKGA